MHHASFGLLAVSFAFLGCSSGGFDVAPAGDSGTTSADSGTSGDSDVPNDTAIAPDVTPLADAPPETIPATSSWCAKDAGAFTFCDDFDTTTMLGAKWDRVSGQGTLLILGSTDAPSPPNVFSAAIADQAETGVISKSFGAPKEKATLEFDLRVERAAVSNALSSIILGGFLLPSFDVGYAGLYLGQDGQIGLGVGEASKLPSIQATGLHPTLGAWSGRFRLEVTFGTEGRAQLYHDGAAIGSPINLPQTLQQPPGITAEIGIQPGGTDGSSEARFDNVVVIVN